MRLRALLLVAVIWGAAAGRQPQVAGWNHPDRPGDLVIHAEIIEQLRAGSAYYPVCAGLLRTHHYALKPFFQWRLPTLAWAIAILPSLFAARVLLAILTLAAIVAWIERLKTDVGFPLACGLACLLAPFLSLPFLGRCVLQHELWAGVLIGLSLAAYPKCPCVTIIAGLAALAIRELALPYVIVMLAWSLWGRRRGEFQAWAAGFVSFAILLAWHALQVQGQLQPGDLSDPTWIRFAGWSHAVACANWLFLWLTPCWFAGAMLVLAISGTWQSRDRRLFAVVAVYTAAFMVAGKPYNHYWGLVISLLLAVGLVYALNGGRQFAASRSRPLIHGL